MDSLLRSTPALMPVVNNAEEHELQVIYTRIQRSANGQPSFQQYTYRLNDKAYFNPASLVKLPVALLALEKLNILRQQVPALTRQSIMATGVAGRCQTAVPFITSTDSNKVASLGNYIKRMLLVSDNQAYNRLYEFLGQQYIHQRLAKAGYPEVRITRRFAPCDTAANRCTNPVTFYTVAGSKIYHQPATCNPTAPRPPLGRFVKGRGYYSAGKFVPQPYDFTTGNYLPLRIVDELLRQTLFPNTSSANPAFALTSADYAFLRTYLGSTPAESGFQRFASPEYFPAYKKYLYYGRQRHSKPQPGLRIYNIVGMSYGYLADCAYFADQRTGVEFILSAVLYVNKDGVLNDGSYEYKSIGLPFLQALGQAIYRFEAEYPHAYPFNKAKSNTE
ncbi:class A beta-lactamase-related serine hydrolase [Hymenobacter latericus]|uniref:class A beta-lactamase-related serine hydrolase n=1 Tax=Hymenobacter sp. YIM 151858-1 TaxID=2987688 RepID=UPI00222617C3|nr:class A beta-lactamase-related serine hydrolase [Hymenobacter sp. YIM 151858-1]UYZ57747.1 class A beta-lactamase-related serine hydrolase [Hymenobacter sp. YIM 151858-1]